MIKLNNKIYGDNFDYEFSKPVEISFMSVDESKNIDFSVKEIAFLNENAKPVLDILSGFNGSNFPTDQDKDEDYILHALINQKINKIVNMKFFSYRGTLTKISSFPYENRENLKFSVIKFNGIIFLWWYRSVLIEETTFSIKSRYAGFRFEKLMTINLKNDKELPNSQFLSMVSRKLKTGNICHDLVFAGEVDCIRKSNNKYIELKTRLGKSNNINYTLKRYNFLRWWLQSYLIGIDTVIVGFRNEDFVVEDIKEFNIDYFVKAAKGFRNEKNLWEPSVCFNFLGNFLTEIESYTMNFTDSDICIVNFNANNKEVTFTKTNQVESPDYDFLPTWFREEYTKV